MYYQIDFDHYERTYQIYRYTGTTKLGRIGTGHTVNNSITFYEKGGATVPATPTPLPVTTSIPTATPIPTSTPFATSIPTITPTPQPTSFGSLIYYRLYRCNSNVLSISIGYLVNDFYDGQLVSGDDGNFYTVSGSTYTDINPGTDNVAITATGNVICPTPTPTPLPATNTPTGLPPTATPTGLPPTVTPISTSPTLEPTPIPGDFGYTVLFGTYQVTSIGYATLSVQNTTSTVKYLWLRYNSGGANTGTFSGSASITTSGFENTIDISGTITSYGQNFDGESSLYLPIGSTYTINVVKTNPSAGSIYITYTDVDTPTKTNVPPL
jgi:hypothetical protein